MQGTIIKIVSKYSYVEVDNKIYECDARGIFRYNKIRPLVGDKVIFSVDKNNKGIISTILERKNILIRPAITNVDQVIIITASKEPRFNTFLLNKYLSFIEYENIKPVLVFTKKDLVQKNETNLIAKIKWYKKLGYIIFWINNKSKSKVKFNKLFLILDGKISVFTGQTGAGKSTTINGMLGEERQKTDEISKALGRGKHTTRFSELFHIKNSKVIDTPGFSSFDIDNIDLSIMAKNITPFKDLYEKCKFKNCFHVNEPKCAIIAATNENRIPIFFYKDYKRLVLELRGKDEKKYR